MNRAEILAGVGACIAEALDVPVDSIREDQRLVGDLGADSLDLLDLTFKLEQRFGISISPRQIERSTQARLGGAPLETDGVYSKEAIMEFRRAMPDVPPEELPDGLAVVDLARAFRVSTMANLVEGILGGTHG
ncbi:MAG: acyl carrier protein [Planctomycetota bacterium]